MSKRLIRAALAIAVAPPQHGHHHRKAYIPWDAIEELREALREGGYVSDDFVDWIEDGKVRRANGMRPVQPKWKSAP